MRPHLSLRVTLASAFSLLAVICAGQGARSIAKLATIRSSVNVVVVKWLLSVIAIKDIRSAASEVRIKQLRLLALSDTPSRLAENDSNLTAMHAKLAEARKSYEPLISSAEERVSYDAFSATWSQFEQADQEARRLMKVGQPTAALTLMSGPDTAHLCDQARAKLVLGIAFNEVGARRDAGITMSKAGLDPRSKSGEQS